MGRVDESRMNQSTDILGRVSLVLTIPGSSSYITQSRLAVGTCIYCTVLANRNVRTYRVYTVVLGITVVVVLVTDSFFEGGKKR